MFYTLNVDTNSMQMFNSMNVNMEVLFREIGIPPRSVTQDKLSVTREQYKTMIQVMDKYMKPESILELAILDSISSFVPEFFAGLCADCGFTCIRRISKYKTIISPIVMTIDKTETTTSISYEYNDGTQVPRTMLMYAQLNLLSIIRKGTGRNDIIPLAISMTKECPKNAIEYIGIEPNKQSSNEIVFKNSDLLLPFITMNNSMWEYIGSGLNQRLMEMQQDKSFSATVRKALFEMIPSGISDAESISKELGMSKRTLQRKLKDEGTTYNEQLNHTRELLVRNYLKMDMPLDEIAFLVNYIDAKSLSRAFKTWTGMSITEYRSTIAI